MEEIMNEKDILKLYKDLHDHDGFSIFLTECSRVADAIQARLSNDRNITNDERQYMFGLKDSMHSIITSFENAKKKYEEKKKD